MAIAATKYESWYNLGNALGQLERYAESANAYNQAYAKHPYLVECTGQFALLLPQ